MLDRGTGILSHFNISKTGKDKYSVADVINEPRNGPCCLAKVLMLK
jgi:hypothetical protein